MSFNYAGLAKSALSNIDKFGRNVTYRTVTKGTYNTATGTKTGGSNTDQTVKAVITAVKKSQIDGEVIQRGDKVALIAASALNVVPNTGDIIIDGTSKLKVVEVMDVEPGDTAILYKVVVRK